MGLPPQFVPHSHSDKALLSPMSLRAVAALLMRMHVAQSNISLNKSYMLLLLEGHRRTRGAESPEKRRRMQPPSGK